MTVLRVWVARPLPAAARTAAALERLGHAPLVVPLLAVAPTGSPPPKGAFDAVLLTSANALDALAGTAVLASPILDLPALAVGARTAEAARAAGFRDVASAEGDAAALAALVRARLRPGAALLHPAGEARKAEPAAGLEAAGFRVVAWTAYAARPLPALPEAAARALDAGELDAMLHYSRRSAATALALAGPHPAFRALAHHCLSPDVAAPLREAGLDPAVASRPEETALLVGLPRRPRGDRGSRDGGRGC